MTLGKTGGPSMTTKPPSGSSTVKPTSVSGNLHAESTIWIQHANTWNQCDDRKNIIHELRENRGTILTTKPSTALATLKPTSASGNLHAESKT